MKRESKSENESILRQKAEALMKRKTSKKVPPLSDFDAMKLLHELEVHQIELELQNEELFLAKEKAAEMATEKYAELYDFAPSAYFTLSRAGDIVELNLCGSQMLGKERSLLKKRRFSFFISDDTKPVFNNFLNNVFISNAKETCELTLCADNNIPIYAHFIGVVTENGEQCMVTAVDITARKQAEEALKRSEEALSRKNEVFSSLLKNLQIGVFMVEAPSGKPLVANDMALKLLGRGILPDASRQNLSDVYKAYKTGSRVPYPPEEMPILLGINGKSAHVNDMMVIRPDGSEIYLEIFGTPVMDQQGKIWASLVSFFDITERKRAEEIILGKNEELQKINGEKDKFFSIIAHDLRSPFNGFLGLTEIMAEGLERMTLDEIQSIAVAMRNSAANLYRLLGNLLEWSRMQRGLTTFNPKSFILMPKISECMFFALEAVNKKEISITFDVPENLEVFADSEMLGGIMRNLVTNAMKFTHRGGSILVSAKPVSGNLVEISVKDSGIGMSQNMVDNLFRLDVNTNRKGTEGETSTGLGLMICRDFVEKNGGKLWAESEERKGSTFRFTLPGKAEA